LLKKSGRQSFARLGLTAMAIAIGVMLISYFTAGVNGLLGLGHRTNHLSRLVGVKQEPIPGVKPARINRPYRGNITDWHGRSIEQLKIYSTAETFKFPELKVMQPGEYYLSPALKKVIDEHPTDDILARFGRFNKYLGTVPEKYLTTPDSLLIISGVDAKEVKEHEERYSKIYRSGFDDDGTSYDAASIVVLSVGGAILLFPIIVFVSVATQLGATQREKRYAALRLIGATKRQVNRVLILESLLASAVGIAIGFIGFWSLQAPLLNFRIDGDRMWPSDMQPSVLQHLVIIALTLGLTAFINWRRMRRAQISPLGVSHTLEKVKKLRIWRVIILAIGLGLFAWLSTKDGRQWIRKDSSGAASSLVFVGAFLTIMLGLVLSGSWLTNKIALLCVHL
ncbi:ABC transporter permease, partial [Candidatus Saccharibacteria bacterium]|nr:ABC transporter permease [Candidatus Saccharibacteria bacterium]